MPKKAVAPLYLLAVASAGLLAAAPARGGMQDVFTHETGTAALLVTTGGTQIVAGARDFVDSMAQRGIAFLADENMPYEKKVEEFRKLLKNSFDMKTIARFSLGTYWRRTTEAQRSEYLKLFENMVLDVYSRRFGDYQGQKFEVREAAAYGENDALVKSVIIQESGPEVKVDWLVRFKDGRYRVVDVIVEGVSMALTQRSDFASVIQRGGGEVDVLLAHLEERQ